MTFPGFGSRADFYTFAPESLAQTLPQFEILREVGKGSMGIVYEARRRADGARVALKVLPPSLTLTERTLARFMREGEVMARVRHPAIVAVHEMGSEGRLHWFVMDYVDGTTLEERLQVGPLPARQAAQVAASAARALQFAHDHGVVHRDVKPGNLMLRGDGHVLITDFGLARETGTGSMTESGTIVGTPMYMAPEQIMGDSADLTSAVDVYGLGATLYQLVTGTPPFAGPSAQSVLKAVLEQDPPAPRRLRRDLPAPLEAIVQKAMEKEPERRYGSAQEMAEDLERFLRGERVVARRRGVPQAIARTLARRPLLTSMAVLLIALAAGAFLLLDQLRRQQLEAALAGAEWALAAAMRDERQQPRPPSERRDVLLQAVATASAVLAEDSTFWHAWFVRAKARHRLQSYPDAVRDLDQAERCLGGPTVDLLYFRIDALGHMHDRESRQRLQQDLATLLELDQSTTTRGIVAEYLLTLGAEVAANDRQPVLEFADRVLQGGPDSDARIALCRARLLELQGDARGALEAVREAREAWEGNPIMHVRAAAMFRRLGAPEEGHAEAAVARLLDPEAGEGAAAAEVAAPPRAAIELSEVQAFLRQLDRRMPTREGGREDEGGQRAQGSPGRR